MGIWEVITDLFEAATPWSVAEAEAAAKEDDTKVRRLLWSFHPACAFFPFLDKQWPYSTPATFFFHG